MMIEGGEIRRLIEFARSSFYMHLRLNTVDLAFEVRQSSFRKFPVVRFQRATDLLARIFHQRIVILILSP